MHQELEIILRIEDLTTERSLCRLCFKIASVTLHVYLLLAVQEARRGLAWGQVEEHAHAFAFFTSTE